MKGEYLCVYFSHHTRTYYSSETDLRCDDRSNGLTRPRGERIHPYKDASRAALNPLSRTCPSAYHPLSRPPPWSTPSPPISSARSRTSSVPRTTPRPPPPRRIQQSHSLRERSQRLPARRQMTSHDGDGLPSHRGRPRLLQRCGR